MCHKRFFFPKKIFLDKILLNIINIILDLDKSYLVVFINLKQNAP